ncbi:MAG TPA: pantoate--beta-alanine ligase [Flavobacteriaceae bacterium]
MDIYHKKNDLYLFIENLKSQNLTIGLVPTMGALHQGHLSIIKKALKENDKVFVSIFVNPTQFDNKEDLEKYPRTFETDIKLIKSLSKDHIIIYAPNVEDVYGDNVNATDFYFDGLEDTMEGKFRLGHFDGVGTIVKRLFEIVKPDNAYFGEKDFQQLMIIKKLVEKFNLPVHVIGCEIYREKDGLAMSSRNLRLKPEYRKEAPFIYRTLKLAKRKFATKSANKVVEWVEKQFKKNDVLRLEYFSITEASTLRTFKRKSKKKSYRAFIAVHADDIRLIDNIALN